MIRRPPRSTLSSSSAASDVYKRQHFTWAGTYVLEAATFLYPDVNFILADADCVPTSLFEVEELVHLAQHLYPQAPPHHTNGAVLLVSEPHAELNAGFVCIGRRDGKRLTAQKDWVEAAKLLVASRERFLLTSKTPKDPTEAAMSGLLLTPLLGCTALHSLCLLYTSPSPRDGLLSRMPSSA